MKWGKVIEKVKVTNLFDLKKSIEVEAVIDTGATMLVLPQNIINELNLRKMREVKVRYANSKTEINLTMSHLNKTYITHTSITKNMCTEES